MESITLFKTIVGSQAYGTNTPESDVDTKGVYVQSINDALWFKYKPQIRIDKDNTMFEVKRFLELLMTGNPNMLELLYSPEKCILEKHELFDIIIKNRDIFLSKKCLNSFIGFAKSQIDKAKGLNKKINWKKDKMERKTPLDFMKVINKDKTEPLTSYLKAFDLKLEYCGITKLDNTEHIYCLFYDYVQAMRNDNIDNPRWKDIPDLHYKGICNDDDILLSEVTKYHINKPVVNIYYNKTAFQNHCRDYLSYQTWLKERNVSRYVDVKSHGQTIDGKNMMHCYRLLNVAKELAEEKTINVFRKDAEYLLDIRKGKVSLSDLISQSDKIIEEIKVLFDKSDLPEEVDAYKVHVILTEIRQRSNKLFK